MSRGLADPAPEPQEELAENETEVALRALIIGHNKLYDRMIDLEKQVDHLARNWEDTKEATPKSLKKKWNKGL